MYPTKKLKSLLSPFFNLAIARAFASSAPKPFAVYTLKRLALSLMLPWMSFNV